MEKPKIYVVMNVNKFKKLCEEKLGDDITANDFIDMEIFKNEKVHLIPNHLPNRYIVGPNIRHYNIYINLQEEWKEKNIVNITERDIEELLEDNAIEDIETHEHWKEILGFKVVDKQSFYDNILPSLTDEEAIGLLKTLSRSYKINVDHIFYLVYDKDIFYIYIHDSRANTSYKLPHTTLDKENLTDLIKQNSVNNITCKINEHSKLINFDGNISNICVMSGFSQGIKILKKNNRYIIREYIRDGLLNPIGHIGVIGSTEKEAIHKFRNALTENLLSRNIYGHKDTSKTFEMYKHVIKSQEDKEF